MISCRHTNKMSNLETVRLLLKNNANINEKNNDGWTALMLSSQHSNKKSKLETVKLLLEHGANINEKEKDGWTALMMASRYSNTTSNLETVKLLLMHGANINDKHNYGKTSLTLAIINSNLETVKLLLDYGADINIIDNYNKQFMNYLDVESPLMTEFLNIVFKNQHYKLCMKLILRDIKKNNLLLNPESLRIKIIEIKWKLDDPDLFDTMVAENNYLLNYFGITDKDILRIKILDSIKYMD